MPPDIEEPFSLPKRPDDIDGFLNGHDCPHCGIWFRLDDAKPAGKKILNNKKIKKGYIADPKNILKISFLFVHQNV